MVEEEVNYYTVLLYLPVAILFTTLLGIIFISTLLTGSREFGVEVIDGIEIVPEIIEAMH